MTAPRERAARLTLICHASTQATRSASFPLDEPLDALGMKRLAAFDRGLLGDPDHALTSPERRCIQTAAGLPLDAVVDQALRDLDFGAWAGRSFTDIQAQEPAVLAAWFADPAAAPHGGESVADLIRRIGAWLEARTSHPGLTVAVTHASVIRAAVIAAIDAGPPSFSRIDIAPLSITRLSAGGRVVKLVSMSGE